jgi:hypothetical protein
MGGVIFANVTAGFVQVGICEAPGLSRHKTLLRYISGSHRDLP